MKWYRKYGVMMSLFMGFVLCTGVQEHGVAWGQSSDDPDILRIFHGGELDERVPETKDTDPGAFTGRIPSDTAPSGYEFQLMKLEINDEGLPSCPEDPTASPDSIEIRVAGKALLLLDQNGTGASISHTFPLTEQIPFLWVEAAEPSQKARDIEITATINGCPNQSPKDIVKATAVVCNVQLSVENQEELVTQCMEGRKLKFTAEVSEFSPRKFLDKMIFTLHYQGQRTDGTWWEKTINEETPFLTTKIWTEELEKVPNGDEDHKYPMTAYVTVASKDVECPECCQSNTLDIDVYELWIKDVRDATKDNYVVDSYEYNQKTDEFDNITYKLDETAKPWKVVVGEEIEYKAIASKNCEEWKWELPEKPEDWLWDRRWKTTGGDAKSTDGGGTPLKIVEESLPKDFEWDHFGDKYGTVQVSCKEGEQIYTISSTQQNPDLKVQVFFDGSQKTPYHPLFEDPEKIPKNFFYYWKYALGNPPNIIWYDYQPLGSTETGVEITRAIQMGDSGHPNFSIEEDYYAFLNARLTNGCPADPDLKGCPMHERPMQGKKGIDLFYVVLQHELQHRIDFAEYFVPDENTDQDSDGDHLHNDADPHPNKINGAGYWEYWLEYDETEQRWVVNKDDWIPDWERRADIAAELRRFIGRKKADDSWEEISEELKQQNGNLVVNDLDDLIKMDWSKNGKQW